MHRAAVPGLIFKHPLHLLHLLHRRDQVKQAIHNTPPTSTRPDLVLLSPQSA